MSACLIAHITVKDPQKWADYRSRVPATLAPWHGQLLLRGQHAEVLAGRHSHTDTVVIRFPNLPALREWYHSPSYQALIPLREAAADMDVLAFEEG